MTFSVSTTLRWQEKGSITSRVAPITETFSPTGLSTSTSMERGS
eukprot:CAMPEP_0172911836 /NCGR_PEP_ID=MMETSP1075-20121228/187342_1 /TAXON_ID=2916 /ORGANISM="Ceratium fusus, Strain PA161109" /LENGTH=43 /DNA_ID= /DNA_START= /DNA_END= /DNA_ORIENTATION=